MFLQKYAANLQENTHVEGSVISIKLLCDFNEIRLGLLL